MNLMNQEIVHHLDLHQLNQVYLYLIVIIELHKEIK